MVRLQVHPETPGPTALSLEAEARRDGGRLLLRYRLTGDIGGILIPPPEAGVRTDELWRTTCFEAFVRAPGEHGYVELNLAPTTRWAVYRFDGYRKGMSPAPLPAPPLIRVSRGGSEFEMAVGADLGGLLGEGPWSLAVTAVIEETDGRRSYWSLRHAPGAPDFHHADGFVLELAAV